MIGYMKITRKDFYASGGFSHPRQCRVMRSNSWQYYREQRR